MIKSIYLCGAMAGLTTQEYSEWRNYIQNKFLEINSDWKCFNPAHHFDFVDVTNGEITERQAMDIDLYNLRRSDLVIFDSYGPKSLGSMAEIAIAYDRKIPVLGINIDHKELHPWIEAMCTKFFDNYNDCIQYAASHFLDVY